MYEMPHKSNGHEPDNLMRFFAKQKMIAFTKKALYHDTVCLKKDIIS